MSIREDLTVPYQHAGSVAKFLAQSPDLVDRLSSRLESLSHDLLYAVYKDDTVDTEALLSNMIMEWNAYRNSLPANHRAMLAPSLIDDKVSELRQDVYRQEIAAKNEELRDKKWSQLGDVNQDGSTNDARKALELAAKYGNTDRTLDVLNRAGERPKISAARDDSQVSEARSIVREDLLPYVAYYRRQFVFARDEGDREQAANAQMHAILAKAFDDLAYGRVPDYETACEQVRREWKEYADQYPTPELLDKAMAERGIGELDAKVNAHEHSVEREERHERQLRGIPEPTTEVGRLPDVLTRPEITRPVGQLASPDQNMGKPTRAVGIKK